MQGHVSEELCAAVDHLLLSGIKLFCATTIAAPIELSKEVQKLDVLVFVFLLIDTDRELSIFARFIADSLELLYHDLERDLSQKLLDASLVFILDKERINNDSANTGQLLPHHSDRSLA